MMPIESNITVAEPPRPRPVQWLGDHGDALYAYALRRVRRPEVAEDLVQETLLAAVQASGGFAQRANVRTWLTGILRHKVADHFRARHRGVQIDAGTLEDDALFDKGGQWRAGVPAWRGDPLRSAEAREFRAAVDACLAKLPATMAHLFLSRVDDGATTDELCGALGITPDNAWTMLHRARLRLRQCLAVNWFTTRPTPSPRRRT